MKPSIQAADTEGAADRRTIAPADMALARPPGARNIIPPSHRSVAGHLGLHV